MPRVCTRLATLEQLPPRLRRSPDQRPGVLSKPMQAPHASSEAVRRSMQANRRVDTKPELRLRSAIHKRGLRFRKDYLIRVGAISVRADIVFPARRIAVFVDGCFWHQCPDHGASPRANSDYWRLKLGSNSRRDEAVSKALREAGWNVARIWEHEDTIEAAERICRLVADQG